MTLKLESSSLSGESGCLSLDPGPTSWLEKGRATSLADPKDCRQWGQGAALSKNGVLLVKEGCGGAQI